MVSGRQKDARATCLGGVAGAVLLAGTAGAQDKIEIRFGTTNPPGGTQYLSGEEWVKRVNEKAGDLVQADIYGSSQLGDDTGDAAEGPPRHPRGEPAPAIMSAVRGWHPASCGRSAGSE